MIRVGTKGFVYTLTILLVLCGAQDPAIAKKLLVDTCRQGECDRLYLLSKVHNPDGTIAVRVFTEFYNADGTAPDNKPRYETAMVSCSLKKGFVLFPGSEPTEEPQKAGGAHATCEPDSLWIAVCGHKFPTTC